jgi:hypothetical protein
MKKAATVTRSPIHHKKTTKKNRRDRGLPRDTKKRRLPGCYIESQATIVKKEQAVKKDTTVRLHLSEHREKNTKKRSTKRNTSTYIVVYKTNRDNSERESRIWT